MSQGIQLRKYGVEFTVDFELYEIDGVDLRTDWTPAAADCEVMKDGGASTQCTNTATDEGSTYSIVITATEAEAARIVIKVVDAATKVFLDKVIVVETYGNASAQHAFDLDTAAATMRGTDDAATAAKLLAYMQVLTRSDPAIKADRSTELAELNTDEGSGAGDYDNAKAALEAIAEPMLIGTVASRTDDTDFTLTATDLTGNDDDHNGQLLVFVTGNNAGLMRIIGDYTGSTDRVQFTGTGFLAGFPNLVQVGDVCRVLSAAI